MREILFRGKRVDNGEWEYGLPSYDDDGDVEEIQVWDEEDVNFYPVDPETICQYTGLIDKNGKKIWEGDILEGHLDDEFPEDVTREKVIWHESGWKTEEPGCNDKEYLDEFDTENFEVVGNVFDNPELLEA